MNTPTHLLVGAAAFGRAGQAKMTIAALLGAAVPDASLYGLVAYERLVNDTDPRVIFDELYFSDGWRAVFQVDNSIFVYGLILAIGAAARWPVLIAFAGAALLHIALDLPFHHDDGRPHFWPVSDHIVASPLSYWDGRRGAGWVGLLEMAIVLATAAALWLRHRQIWARALIALAALATFGTSAFWRVFFSTGGP